MEYYKRKFKTTNLTQNLLPILAFLLLVSIVISCGRNKKKRDPWDPPVTHQDSLSTGLQSILKPVKEPGNINSLSLPEYVRYTYQLNNYQPIWLTNGKISEGVELFLNELDSTRYDGFDPELYNLKGLSAMASLLAAHKDSMRLEIMLDTSFTHFYLDAAHDLLMGQLEPETADPIWYHINDTTWDAPKTLAATGNNYYRLDHFRSNLPTYNLLRNEYMRTLVLTKDSVLAASADTIEKVGKQPNLKVLPTAYTTYAYEIIKRDLPWLISNKDLEKKKVDTVSSGVLANDEISTDTLTEEQHWVLGYQYYHGLPPTGKLDIKTMACLAIPVDRTLKKLEANMERIRWMERDFGDFYIVVDIPLMEFLLRKTGKDLMRMRVVVGKPERPTPSFYALMANIVINPPWGVPPTILKKDVLPGIEKDGKKYLAKKGLKVYDSKGKLVNAALINARNYKRYTYRQDPGSDNSLGYVKFNLRNPFNIYLHDTPHRGDFVKNYRALSSGCIRLQQPQELAIYILAELEKMKFTQEVLTKKISTHKTESVMLKTKIPVHITYLTTFEDSTRSHIRLLNDVYKHDSLLVSMLK